MKKLVLVNKGIGKHEPSIIRRRLDEFVHKNFNILYEGAIRMGAVITDDGGSYVCAIEEDYYAPRRIQVGRTRLHAYQGLKYAHGHKYDSDRHITDDQIVQTVSDIQKLLDAAGNVVKSKISLHIN